MISEALPVHLREAVSDWPPEAQDRFVELRQIVLDTADQHPLIGRILEPLKWGEPAFQSANGSGSTLRIAWKAKTADAIGLFVICRTDLLEQVRQLYPDSFQYEGTRAARLSLQSPVPEEAVAYLASCVLTYHL